MELLGCDRPISVDSHPILELVQMPADTIRDGVASLIKVFPRLIHRILQDARRLTAHRHSLRLRHPRDQFLNRAKANFGYVETTLVGHVEHLRLQRIHHV